VKAFPLQLPFLDLRDDVLVEPYGSAGNWRVRCIRKGCPHPESWGMTRTEALARAKDVRWWHDTDGGRRGH